MREIIKRERELMNTLKIKKSAQIVENLEALDRMKKNRRKLRKLASKEGVRLSSDEQKMGAHLPYVSTVDHLRLDPEELDHLVSSLSEFNESRLALLHEEICTQ